MKKSYSVLVLTDHSKHSVHNSVYALVRGMLASDRCRNVDVASRGLAINNAFFDLHDQDQLYASSVKSDFDFDPSGMKLASSSRRVQLAKYDLVFLRLPRPISDVFLEWLPTAFPGVPMVNHPEGILTTSTKAFLLNFPEICPEMRLCYSVEEVLEEAQKQAIVLKPLQEYGGKGILKIKDGVVNDGERDYSLINYLPSLETTFKQGPLLAMQFLKNVDQGDKRIIVVDGEIMAASLRLPASDSWLCNVARGGTSVVSEVTPEEEHIIATISPRLKAEGILIFGADTLVNDDGQRVLSEVNTLSIGGFPQAEAQTGLPIISQTIQKIFNYADSY